MFSMSEQQDLTRERGVKVKPDDALQHICSTSALWLGSLLSLQARVIQSTSTSFSKATLSGDLLSVAHQHHLHLGLTVDLF